jgi:uncharacterized protein (DUF342 family)
MVVASDGIMNSFVDAHNRIICQGKRAHIVGGRLRASEEINAKVLGNPTTGTETICEVGVDPKSKEEQERLQMEKDNCNKLLEDIKLDIQTLINIKQQKSLTEEKEAYLQDLMTKRNLLTMDIMQIDESLAKIQAYLNSLKSHSKVSASTKVYPGVKIIIRDARYEVRSEYKAVSFVLESGLVKVAKYEEPDPEAIKGPDGYTTT